MAAELDVGALLLKDILAQLTRPGRDPREDLPPPIFKNGILKLDDLAPGMELSGTVLNVVDFGAFVDIGLHDSGLVHISQLANKFVRDPHEVVSVGDIVKVWVHEIDKTRRRVSLTMIAPGTRRGESGGRHPAKQSQSTGRGGGERPRDCIARRDQQLPEQRTRCLHRRARQRRQWNQLPEPRRPAPHGTNRRNVGRFSVPAGRESPTAPRTHGLNTIQSLSPLP